MIRTATIAILAGSVAALAQTPAAQPEVKTVTPKVATAAFAPSAFGWYAEVVSFDAATRTLTAKAKAEPHVAARAKGFKTGDRVVLSWTAHKGEADAVRSVTGEKATVAESGYLVRAKFVGVDAGTMTFATTVPAAVATTLGSAKAGTPVRVAAPLVQPGPDAVITAVALGRTAPARPAPVVAARPVESARQMAGAWDVATNMMGNAMKLVCTFTQEGAKLGGTCNGPGPFANLPASGKIDGDEVSFGFAISQPVSLTLLHRGKLDGAGTKVEGELDLMGNATPFVATRKQ